MYLGAVIQFAVALCHSVVLQAFWVFYTTDGDIRGLASLHCVCHTKLFIHFCIEDSMVEATA